MTRLYGFPLSTSAILPPAVFFGLSATHLNMSHYNPGSEERHIGQTSPWNCVFCQNLSTHDNVTLHHQTPRCLYPLFNPVNHIIGGADNPVSDIRARFGREFFKRLPWICFEMAARSNNRKIFCFSHHSLTNFVPSLFPRVTNMHISRNLPIIAIGFTTRIGRTLFHEFPILGGVFSIFSRRGHPNHIVSPYQLKICGSRS